MSCSNNLKQLGIALHNYHDVQKRFPVNTHYNAPIDEWVSNFVLLLPYIEQTGLESRIDFTVQNSEDQVIDGTKLLQKRNDSPAAAFLFVRKPHVAHCETKAFEDMGGA